MCVCQSNLSYGHSVFRIICWNHIGLGGEIMANIIGSERNGNYGEDIFIDKIKEYFDDSYVVYRNRQLYGKEYDVCILLPNKGILVVELKGWREETILRVENDMIIINTDDGEVPSSPQKQARGYRFILERYIKNSLGINPLVFQMACLPQVSTNYYHLKRLDIVTEEKFTILKDDLATNTAFFKKLDEALREVNYWYRDPFDKKTMDSIRRLFEPDYEPAARVHEQEPEIKNYHKYDYSRFYFFKAEDSSFKSSLTDMVQAYGDGCKLFCVFSQRQQLIETVEAIDKLINSKGLIRKRDNLEIDFDGKGKNFPQISTEQESFSCFHCSFSLLINDKIGIDQSFCIINGSVQQGQYVLLEQIDKSSSFNSEQYLIEHAPPEKNIVIRAGAGTGKTHTMISRIGFVCYSQSVPLPKMANRITMITFTNEAADQMEEKLKIYFRNCYLLSSNSDYLEMISLIDHMQICTIHSYAKYIITKLGTEFGYGVDLAITSSEYNRKQKVAEYLDFYIRNKERLYGNYTTKLGMPVYAIRDLVLAFTEKLNNKSVCISDLSPSDFGTVSDPNKKELHQLLAEVIPDVDKEFNAELRDNNRIHLSSMMSVLHSIICSPQKTTRVSELNSAGDDIQFMFVDEFQDTDDVQIEVLLELARCLNFRLFVVGDIKQCIYRFRGAKEKAFDQLGIDAQSNNWLEFSLRRNYRTDRDLLDIYHQSFEKWGSRADELLSYSERKDRLIGTRSFNSYSPILIANKSKFYHRCCIANERDRIRAIYDEIQRIQNRIKYEEGHGHVLKASEKSIAILVRENWQADLIRQECKRKYNLDIQTSTGGDLFTSQPAMDMLTLVNALLHFDEAEYLYNLATSNFFNLDLPKAALFNFRKSIKDSWRMKDADKVTEQDIVNYIIDYLNPVLARIDGRDGKWEYVIHWLRMKPILKVLRDLYVYLQPWKNYNPNSIEAQRYYQINVDLIFEYLINTCNIDKLTINTLYEHLYSSIASHVSVDSRSPEESDNAQSIQCITVHKSKGLEYGHVILPYCSFPIDKMKKAMLHVSAEKQNGRVTIGYRIEQVETGAFQNSYYNISLETEERSREETRVLYVAMTRAIRSFSWIEVANNRTLNWQNLIEKGD